MFIRLHDIDQLSRLSQNLFSSTARNGHTHAAASNTAPRTNVYETQAAFLVQLEVPGFAEDDFKLTLDGRTLTVEGRHQPALPEGAKVLRQERGAQTFSRAFTLPEQANPAEIEANLKNGILTVTVGKRPESVPRKIDIKVA